MIGVIEGWQKAMLETMSFVARSIARGLISSV